MISRRSAGGSRAVQIRPVYGTDSRKMATSRLNSSSLDQIGFVELHAAGRPEPGKTDRVRADVVVLLQVQGVAHQAQHLEPPVVQPEQGADAHVVALRLHRPGHAVEPPEVVGFAVFSGWTRR